MEVQFFISESSPQEKVSKSIGVSDSIFGNSITQFELYGESAFEKSYTFYSTQHKINVLNYMVEQGTSIR